MKKRNQTCGDARSSANTRSDERRKTLSLVTAVIMAVSCIACVIIKAVGKGCFSVHEILLYAAWALLAAESSLAAFSMTVEPSASTAAMMVLMVAPTEEQSK